MSKARTQSQWDRLMFSFREYPGNFTRAGALANCDARTAKVAWEKGWPEQKKRPIKDILAEDKKLARAERMVAVERERRDRQERQRLAQQDRLDVLKNEALLVRNARTNAIAMNSVTARLATAAIPLAERLKASLETSQLNPMQAINLLRGVVFVARQTSEVSARVLEMERLRLGHPLDPDKPGVPGAPAGPGDDPTAGADIEDHIAELAGLKRTLEAAKARGWIDASDLTDDELDTIEVEGAFDELLEDGDADPAGQAGTAAEDAALDDDDGDPA